MCASVNMNVFDFTMIRKKNNRDLLIARCTVCNDEVSRGAAWSELALAGAL